MAGGGATLFLLAGRLLPLVLLLLCAPPGCQGKAEDTPVDQLAWHDGMLFFGGALRKTVPANASGPDVAAQAVPCACSDGDPRDESTLLVTVDCFYQAYFGSCNASFMSSYLQELLGLDGFCQISCGRCPCCVTPWELLHKLNATRFLQALQVANPSLEELLRHPGLMRTILVPTDPAWDAALAQYGTLLQDAALLQQVLKLHMIPPEPVRRGLWTTPFMAVGATLHTEHDGPATLRALRSPLPPGVTAYGGLTGLKIHGPANSATVLKSDIMSCKSYLTLIDAVLLPFDPANLTALAGSTPADHPGSSGPAVAAALGVAPTCGVQANALINGSAIVQDGAANRKKTATACCASCQASPGCNAWQYCAQKGGCKTSAGTVYKFGWCQLLHSPEVAEGLPPTYGDWGPITVPFLAGF